jgi:hypothetical protein
MRVYQIMYKMTDGSTLAWKLFREPQGAEDFKRHVMKTPGSLTLLGISQIYFVERVVE